MAPPISDNARNPQANLGTEMQKLKVSNNEELEKSDKKKSVSFFDTTTVVRVFSFTEIKFYALYKFMFEIFKINRKLY